MRSRLALLLGFLILCAGAALAVALSVARWPNREPPLPDSVEFPDNAQVARIVVRLYNSCNDDPDEPEFDLPLEFVPEVLAVLRPVRVVRHHPSTQEYGTMRLKLHDGREYEVRLQRLNKEPVLYSVDGVPCTRGGRYMDMAPGKDKYLPESFAFEGLLRELASLTKGCGSRGRAREILNKFEQSAGRGAEAKKLKAG
jgi:hypothetical protein